ncbi:hypothetical protein [Photobacterium salinisoli]|uniref:hypothetical protein n=1 Tax=Photobacterium salinisoli TaxID=1616783 RepID=UPI0013C5083F|nr:hypothetical protein [Photobacterium salinisoli]
MNQENFTILVSVISLLVAALALYFNYKSHCVTRKSYLINRELSRNGNIYLDFVKVTQLDDRYVIHLVVFNPSEIGLILHGLAVFKEIESKGWINKVLNAQEWEKINKAIWWPTIDLEDLHIKYRDEEYKNMYVENARDIYVSIPGEMLESYHRFEIMTNLGGFSQKLRPSVGRSFFSHNFRQIWYEK